MKEIQEGFSQEILNQASRKLERTIQREGDKNGFYRQSWYFDQLCRELVCQNAITKYYMKKAEESVCF